MFSSSECHVELGLTQLERTSEHYLQTFEFTIALLKIINYYVCPEMKTMFYNCYFMSISDYCCFIWGKRKECSHKITPATRIILNKPALTPSIPLFKELKWLTFPDRCNYHYVYIKH